MPTNMSTTVTSPILINISDLGLSGRVRLVLKPKIDQFPFFGGLQFCFLDVPEISFSTKYVGTNMMSKSL